MIPPCNNRSKYSSLFFKSGCHQFNQRYQNCLNNNYGIFFSLHILWIKLIFLIFLFKFKTSSWNTVMLLIQLILSSQDSAWVSSTCIVVCCRSFLEVALNSVTENSNRLINLFIYFLLFMEKGAQSIEKGI